MKKILILAFFTFSFLSAQDLTGIKICLDPGHGGHESDDRYQAATGFWESDGNLTKAQKLEKILKGLGAEVKVTRTGNDGITDDPSLSARLGMAETFNADIFISIHSNGFNGGANYTMEIFNGKTDSPRNSNAKILATDLAATIYAANRTSKQVIIGDLTLNPTWSNGYGVLYGASMPAVISEGSFHDHLPESWRLMNISYRENEAWGLARGIVEYFNQPAFSVASLASIISDATRPSSWSSSALVSRDRRLPINNATATLNPGNIIYNCDDKNNGYFAIDSLAPGDYTLLITAPGYSSITKNISLTGGITHFSDITLNYDGIYPPNTPEQIHVTTTGENTIHVECGLVENADEYILYFYNSDMTVKHSLHFDNPLMSFDLVENIPVLFRCAASNAAGISPVSSELYGFARHNSNKKVLVVNGFDRSTNTTHDYIRFYGDAIVNGGYGFDYVLNENIIDTTVNLNDYKNVIWILGNESTADETFSSTEQNIVKQFLQNGGNLFISGAEIAWDLDYKGSSEDQSFFHDYLKASYSADAPANTQGAYYGTSGVTGSIFEGLDNIIFDDGTHGTYDVDWPDALIADDSAKVVLRYNYASTHNNAAIIYRGPFPDSDIEGTLIYLAFPFETIYPADSRNAIMKKVLDYFLSFDEEIIIPSTSLKINKIYPNPFHKSAVINFSIINQGGVDLTVYDINGRLIKKLIENKSFENGDYDIQWKGLNEKGLPVSSGVYIINLLFDNKENHSKRCILLK